MRTLPAQFRLAALLGGLLLLACADAGNVRAADPLVDGAVTALAALTNPGRLELLSDEDQFRAQLGPALGWLHVARRRDVSPEAVIVRAFAANGLTGDRARLTREALLRNLARADAWELFSNDVSARALSQGQPAPIPAGIHRGHLARASVVVPEGLGTTDRRLFACLTLRADDEPPLRRSKPYRPQAGDMLARRVAAPVAGRKARPARKAPVSPGAAPVMAPPPSTYDEPLPAP